MEFVEVQAGKLNITDANLGLTLLIEGIITSSYNTSINNQAGISAKDDAVLFSLSFVIKSDITLSDVIDITSRYTRAEAYNNNSELMDLGIEFTTEEGISLSGDKFELYQNRPNPFKNETVISFNLPIATTATLKIFDVSGKVLKVIEGEYARGYNEVVLDGKDLQSIGLLYYQLDTSTDTDTKKMFMID